MKEDLCQTFCDNLRIRNVPAGLAVSTAFLTSSGDRVGFFISPDKLEGLSRIYDSGMQLVMLEASGFNWRSGQRAVVLEQLRSTYGVSLDHEAKRFYIGELDHTSLPAAAMRFVAFELRLEDFALMTEARVASTFRDDVSRLLRETIGDRAVIRERAPIRPELSDFDADFVVEPKGRPPVGIFLGTSDVRVLEAVIVQMRAQHEVHMPCAVVVILERDRSVSSIVRRQATNRVTAITEFRGDEIAAIQKVASEALGRSGQLH